jgi:hypothetical protein
VSGPSTRRSNVAPMTTIDRDPVLAAALQPLYDEQRRLNGEIVALCADDSDDSDDRDTRTFTPRLSSLPPS